jgi:hypothetical protein
VRIVRWLLALVGVLLVATVAAGAVFVLVEGESSVEAEKPRPVAPWPRCAEPTLAYSIAYPRGWHHDGNCAFFDPEQITVPENSDFYGAALEVQVAQDSWANVVRGLTDGRFFRTISRRQVRVNGRPAAVVEVESTGAGLFERGYRLYAYLVDVPARPPIVVQATRQPGEGWGNRKLVADRAVRSVRLTDPGGAGLPPSVARKRAAILAAARARDYEDLARPADVRQFTYTFGGPQPGGPAAYWRETARTTGRHPADFLAALLQMPYTRAQNIFIWPFAYDRPPASLTAAERRVLAPVATEEQLDAWAKAGSYLGWRAGISADGRWIFFVAGD